MEIGSAKFYCTHVDYEPAGNSRYDEPVRWVRQDQIPPAGCPIRKAVDILILAVP